MEANQLSDDELRTALKRLAVCERALFGDLLRHLIEADVRRLAGGWGFDSLFAYCTSELRFSEGAAYKRINAARLAARVPLVLEYLDAGRVHLDAVVSLAAHLDLGNATAILDRATGMTSRDVQILLAVLAPKPDRPDFLRSLPAPSSSVPAVAIQLTSNAPQPSEPLKERATRLLVEGPRDRVEPRSPGRHYVGFTAGDRLREKLERAHALIRQSQPGAVYEDVIEQALDAWLENRDPMRAAARREARRRKTPITANTRSSNSSERAPLLQAIRDAVFLRDGGRCTHRTKDGTRCRAMVGLEIDHVVPKAKGGADDLSNLRLLCREHNRTEAVREFGAALVGPQRRRAIRTFPLPLFEKNRESG